MKVYTNPIHVISSTFNRISATDFFDGLCNGSIEGFDYSNNDIDRASRFEEDDDVYAALFLTAKKRDGVCRIKKTDGHAILIKDVVKPDVGEFNLLMIKKESLKGVYIHYRGGFSPSSLKSASKTLFAKATREKYKTKKNNEKFEIANIITSADLVKKIKEFSKVSHINMRFSHKNFGKASKFLPLSGKGLGDKSLNIGISFRVDNIIDRLGVVDQGVVEDLEEIINEDLCSSMSIKGELADLSAVDTINILETVGHINIEEFDDVLELIHECDFYNFMESKIFLQTKDLIMTGNNRRLFL